jgi:hypothetical protein
MYTEEQIENAVKTKGYVWFDDNLNKGYDVNIVSIRNSDTDDKVTNLFDDTITITYKNKKGEVEFRQWPCTTDPGKKSVIEFKNPKGVGRLKEGQYRGSHEIRKHQGKYNALCQKGLLEVYRDKNKDMVYDENKTEKGSGFGINIHHAGSDSTFVDLWSMGCTVFKKIADFNEFMKICYKAKAIHGNSFTYTLLESKDIV